MAPPGLYAFVWILRTNINDFPVQHQLTCLYNRDGVSFLCGENVVCIIIHANPSVLVRSLFANFHILLDSSLTVTVRFDGA
jgi:hypothetical protein